MRGRQKLDFFVQKSWYFCNIKYFSQNIMTPCYSYYFCIFYIFHVFEIIMVSLFLARHDRYFIMFKIQTFLEFTNFPSKRKYNNTALYSVNSTYLLSRGKLEKNCWNISLIKSTVYLLILRQNSMIFKGNLKSLTESYFSRELRLGES